MTPSTRPEHRYVSRSMAVEGIRALADIRTHDLGVLAIEATHGPPPLPEVWLTLATILIPAVHDDMIADVNSTRTILPSLFSTCPR
jgi:hypothetical protein